MARKVPVVVTTRTANTLSPLTAINTTVAPTAGSSLPSRTVHRPPPLLLLTRWVVAVTSDECIIDAETQCPGCPDGGLDLTPALFEFLAGSLDAGVIYGTWEYQ
ncbi:hypothetical protein NM688_g4634 [Phlebia brevispora]|uniref:Uncharacterized protein n=1 Tax=Phlebia brevispora TaxID=194682 RepID=A0ACC1T2E6_9APHY|nr:hypothetical protein NM688_g4634 [Phlebia brevispora]